MNRSWLSILGGIVMLGVLLCPSLCLAQNTDREIEYLLAQTDSSSSKAAEKQSPSDRDNLFRWTNGKKLPPPNQGEQKVSLEFSFFFTRIIDSEVQFASGQNLNLRSKEGGLDAFTLMGEGKVKVRFLATQLHLSVLRTNMDGNSRSRSRDITIEGRLFSANQNIEVRQNISRVGAGVSYGLMPNALQGMDLDILFSVNYLRIFSEVSNDNGQKVRALIASVVPKFGLALKFQVLYSNPQAFKELLNPHGYLSLFFQVQAIGKMKYGSRRIKHNYEWEGGLIFAPADFVTLSLTYKHWAFRIGETKDEEEILFFSEGVNFAMAFTF